LEFFGDWGFALDALPGRELDPREPRRRRLINSGTAALAAFGETPAMCPRSLSLNPRARLAICPRESPVCPASASITRSLTAVLPSAPA
jgi:hypothetical protein